MKQRTTALVLAAALALSLLGASALAAESDTSAPEAPAAQARPCLTTQRSRTPRPPSRTQRTRPQTSPLWRNTYLIRWGPSPLAT